MSIIKKLLHVYKRVRSLFLFLKKFGSLFLLLCILLLSALYTVIKNDPYYPCPDTDPISTDYFPLICIEVYPDTHLFFWLAHVAWIIGSLHMLNLTTEFKTAYRIFLLIHIIGLADYFLIYGQTWFYAGSAPVSYNIVKVLIFVIAITNEILKELDT